METIISIKSYGCAKRKTKQIEQSQHKHTNISMTSKVYENMQNYGCQSNKFS